MKKILITALAFLMLCGCYESGRAKKKNSAKGCEKIAGIEWVSNTESCYNNLFFGENGEFNNYCDCGEPVGYADVIESYSYSDSKKTVTLLSDGEAEGKGKILYCDEHYLIIDMFDEVITYTNAKKRLNEVRKCALEYTGTDDLTKAQLAVLGYEGGKLKVSQYEYDADAAADFTVWELPCAEDIKFTDVSVTVENGKETVEYNTLSKSDYEGIGEFYHNGFVEMNEDGKVSGVIFYGELIIYK